MPTPGTNIRGQGWRSDCSLCVASKFTCDAHFIPSNNNIRDNIKCATARRVEVASHPMCAQLQEDTDYVYVIYPPGDFPVGGLRSAKRVGGSSAAWERCLAVMERHWQESFPGYQQPRR